MSRSQALIYCMTSDARTTDDLVALLDQSLADTLDLAFQIERAHWTVDGQNACGLRQLFENLHVQLAAYVDDFDQRVVTLGSQTLETLRTADKSSVAAVDPLDARGDKIVLNDLVDRCGEYSGRIRTASRRAERLGDPNIAAFCKGVSQDMDKTLWMLTSIQVA
jgi:DNA-binding ferritin-like protein